MSNKTKNVAILANALVWAGAILMVSWFTKGAVDDDTSLMMTMFLLVGWLVMNGFLTETAQSGKQEIKCVKRLFRLKK